MNAARCQYFNDCANALPNTGADVMSFGLIGLGLVAAGAIIAVASGAFKPGRRG